MNIITRSFLSNVKKHAKILQVEKSIKHTKALDLAAQEVGFPSYYALQIRFKRLSNHESDMGNANKGTDGVNITYAKAQGNKGKLLNPSQKSSLIVVFNDDLRLYRHQYENGEVISIREDFQTEYLDKGFAEKIGARTVSFKELKHRSLQAPGGELGKDFLHEWDYTCIEFLRDKDNPWSIEDADQLVKERVGTKIGSNYREFFYLDGILMDNHIEHELDREWSYHDDIDYCPAIDGY